MGTWYSRPVLFVESVERAAAFYVDKLGFKQSAQYAENGRLLVAHVGRDGCDLLLNCQQPHKTGKSRVFISLDRATLTALHSEFEQRGAPVTDGWWGYDTMIVLDPDGNELFFPYPGAPDA